MPLNKFEQELKSAILLQKVRKEDFFDTPLRNGYVIVAAGGDTLYLLDLIRYMHSAEQHIIKATSLTSMKEYDLNPAKLSVMSTKDFNSKHRKVREACADLIDTGRSFSMKMLNMYLGFKDDEFGSIKVGK